MNLEIGRLVLDVPGVSSDQARVLAERIALALAQGAPGGAADRIVVTVPPGATPTALAAGVAAQARGQLKSGA